MTSHASRLSLAAGMLASVSVMACTPLAIGQPQAPYGEPQRVADVTDPRLDEASGLAASRKHPGLYYTHNDSGGTPDVFVLDREGHVRAVIRLRGAKNKDWEDIAIAPGKDKGTFDICVADIGDNKAKRGDVELYRFPEPDLPAKEGEAIAVDATEYHVRYAEGPQNAEGFIVDPASGTGYILTKREDGKSYVYRVPTPWDADKPMELQRIGELKFPSGLMLELIVTGADVSPDGRRLATRSYLCGWEWRLPDGAPASDFERIFEQTPARLVLAVEPQGEAICYSAAGDALLTISEKSPTALFEVRATAPTSAESPN